MLDKNSSPSRSLCLANISALPFPSRPDEEPARERQQGAEGAAVVPEQHEHTK